MGGSHSNTNSSRGNLMVGKKENSKGENENIPGRLLARPSKPVGEGLIGLRSLGMGEKRDGLLYVPANYTASHPAPLAILLHGAGGNASQAITIFKLLADITGLIILAPDSRYQSWDLIVHRYGVDIAFIDSALERIFSSYAIDPDRMAIGGFSDGASYALSVGLTNGDLFTHIIAFSPGFMASATRIGSPRLFISHGTEDNILSINVCSRKIVPQLESADCDVVYREFNGGHEIPPAIVSSALTWFLG